MSLRRGEQMDCKVYVGGLPSDATSQELEDAFYRYGSIRKVWVARRPPGFAFIEFDDPRDAKDAVRALDGSRICGVRVRVEHCNGGRRNAGGGGGSGYREGKTEQRYSRSRSRSPYRGRSRSPPPRNPRSRDDSKRSNSRSLTRSP